MLHEEDISWCFISSLNLRNQHHTVFRDDERGLQCESITNKTDNGYGTGKCNSYFFIDHDEREFLNLTDLVDAYNEKFKFDNENPDHEVKYIKIITKRTNPPSCTP